MFSPPDQGNDPPALFGRRGVCLGHPTTRSTHGVKLTEATKGP